MGRGKTAPLETIVCPICSMSFVEKVSKRRKYCSLACGFKAQAARYSEARDIRQCENCGEKFEVAKWDNDRKYCSLICKQTAVSRRTAAKRSAKLRAKGAKPSTYRKLHSQHEHRRVAEAMLGRPLKRGEVVHHKDENKHNNSPDNLEVLESQSVHASLHGRKRHSK